MILFEVSVSRSLKVVQIVDLSIVCHASWRNQKIKHHFHVYLQFSSLFLVFYALSLTLFTFLEVIIKVNFMRQKTAEKRQAVFTDAQT